MFDWFKRWRRRRILARSPVPDADWERALSACPLAEGLNRDQLARLRESVALFLVEKDFYGADGLTVTREMASLVALQSCLPVLDLGYEWLDGWYSIYLYPGRFRTRRAYRDELGLMSEDQRELVGEAQHTGGLVYSWEDIVEDIEAGNDGSNVIVHEIAHKLDMLNGDADGYPPLHRGMDRGAWASALGEAFEDLNERLDQGRRPPIDPYAATDPAEFFAVTSELYFENPDALRRSYPKVHAQYLQFYHRQF